MNILKGDVIKHVRALDTALLVLEIKEQKDRLQLVVAWINQGVKNAFLIPTPSQIISINNTDLSNWSICQSKTKSIRNEKWETVKGAA